ncbi:hypothetical protein NPIL_698891 [Nephila pilipes]|uniref:Uncharacterized protein n=1 Tax=Nephila pilipes TaxID=299642 RepID=A0A8X6U360_NEPPI|nr:hypothetical protein NPIL_698891 [Nephila pilipes]
MEILRCSVGEIPRNQSEACRVSHQGGILRRFAVLSIVEHPAQHARGRCWIEAMIKTDISLRNWQTSIENVLIDRADIPDAELFWNSQAFPIEFWYQPIFRTD